MFSRKLYYDDFDKLFPKRHEIINAEDKKFTDNNNNNLSSDANRDIINNIEKEYGLFFKPATLVEKNHLITYSQTLKQKEYRLHMFGSVYDGTNIHVTIKNCPIYIVIYPSFKNISIEQNKTVHQDNISDEDMNKIHNIAINEVKDILNKYKKGKFNKSDNIDIKKEEVLYRKIANDGFYVKKKKCTRIYFNTNIEREDAIKTLSEHIRLTTAHNKNPNFIIAEDDLEAKMYNILTRQNNNFSTVSWLHIKKFTYFQPTSKNTYDRRWSKYKLNIECDFNDIIILNQENFAVEHPNFANKFNFANKNILLTWDSETERQDPTKDAKYSTPFMYGLTAHYFNSSKPLIKIVISSIDIDYLNLNRDLSPDLGHNLGDNLNDDLNHDLVVIITKDEKELLLCLADVIEEIQPTLIVGHNDREFDWKVTVKRLKKYDLLLDFYHKLNPLNEHFISDYETLKRNGKYKKNMYKLTPDVMLNHKLFDFNSIILLDTSALFRKLNPKSRSYNLNFVCKVNGLDGKEYMPYQTMWEIAEKRDAKRMIKVAIYCAVDALRCCEYLNKIGILLDIESKVELSKTTLKDGFTRANSHKVANIICVYYEPNELDSCFPLNPNKYNKSPNKVKETISGGFVRNVLIKTLNRETPSFALDFSSLYPSIIMGFNLSPETLVYTNERKEELENQGFILYPINVTTSIGKEYKAWSVRHNEDIDKMGAIARMELDLFKRRKAIRNDYYEELESFVKTAKPEWIINNKDEFDAKVLEFLTLKGKQEALKEFMNSVYGVFAQDISVFFNIYISGAITSIGQQQAKMVGNNLTDEGYKIVYGDTDSVYVIGPESEYTQIREDHKSGKLDLLEYHTALVNKTFDLAKLKFNSVNSMLREINQTSYLKVAYEEVLHPAQYFMPKNYAGLAHIAKVNFNIDQNNIPKNIMVRGIDAIKQGFEQFIINTTWKILRRMMSIYETLDTEAIIKEELKNVFDNLDKYDISMFIKTAQYKPHKKNIKVNNFVKRMMLEHGNALENNDEIGMQLYKVPEPNNKFDFTIVKKQIKYTINGKKIPLSGADKMEYIEVVQHFNLPIDYEYFIAKSFGGTCAKFLSYKPEFNFDQSKLNSHGFVSTNDNKKISALAKKYIIEYCATLNSSNNLVNFGNIGQSGIKYSHYYKVFLEYLHNYNRRKYISINGFADLLQLIGGSNYTLNCDEHNLGDINRNSNDANNKSNDKSDNNTFSGYHKIIKKYVESTTEHIIKNMNYEQYDTNNDDNSSLGNRRKMTDIIYNQIKELSVSKNILLDKLTENKITKTCISYNTFINNIILTTRDAEYIDNDYISSVVEEIELDDNLYEQLIALNKIVSDLLSIEMSWAVLKLIANQ